MCMKGLERFQCRRAVSLFHLSLLSYLLPILVCHGLLPCLSLDNLGQTNALYKQSIRNYCTRKLPFYNRQILLCRLCVDRDSLNSIQAHLLFSVSMDTTYSFYV